MSILQAIRDVVDPQRVRVPSSSQVLVLDEDNAKSKCKPVNIHSALDCWALRLLPNDHLKLLANLPKSRESVQSLPDYVVFSMAKVRSGKGNEVLQVLVCELKSSAAGADASPAQIRLGKLLADYLIQLGVHYLGYPKPPDLYHCGAVISPEFSSVSISKGRTRPGKVDLPRDYDALSRMQIYQIRDGTDFWLESIF